MRREMEICPHCGALESARIYATRKDAFGNVARFRKCKSCGKNLETELLFRPQKRKLSD